MEVRGKLVVLNVLAGVPFVVHVTLAAVRDLALAPGAVVWLIIKTDSIVVME
jgi:molybdopterin-binding protein